MTGHQKFPSIEAFDRMFVRETWEGLETRRRLRLRPKSKLHGENTGIRFFISDDGSSSVAIQGRAEDITGEDDRSNSVLLAKRVEAGAEFLKPAMYGWLDARGITDQPLTVFGEFSGQGVKKGQEANCKVKEKGFYPFAILVGELTKQESGRRTGGIWITKYEEVAALVQGFGEILDMPVVAVPFSDDAMIFDFTGGEETIAPSVSAVNQMVSDVEKFDPFIHDLYGIEGPGEGFVFMPEVGYDDAMPNEVFEKLCFKAKTQSHMVRMQPKPVQPRVETPASVIELVAQFCTEARLQQGVDETCNGTPERRGTGAFLAWMKSDVRKEAGPEIEALGVDDKMIDSEIANASRPWFLERCAA